jgi:hypothetical protein
MRLMDRRDQSPGHARPCRGGGDVRRRTRNEHRDAKSLEIQLHNLEHSATLRYMDASDLIGDGGGAGPRPAGGAADQSVSRVRLLARELETEVAVQELAAGRRDEMARVLALVDGLRRLADAASGAASSAGRPRLHASSPDSRDVVPPATRPRRRSGTAGGGSGTSYFRTDVDLIKLGQVGTRKEYRHVVPLAAVKAAAEWMGGRVSPDDAGVTFELAIEELGARFKGYQIRAAIGWLRDVGLLQMPTRGRYVAAAGIASEVGVALQSIPVESARRQRRKSSASRGKGSRRRKAAA